MVSYRRAKEGLSNHPGGPGESRPDKCHGQIQDFANGVTTGAAVHRSPRRRKKNGGKKGIFAFAKPVYFSGGGGPGKM